MEVDLRLLFLTFVQVLRVFSHSNKPYSGDSGQASAHAHTHHGQPPKDGRMNIDEE